MSIRQSGRVRQNSALHSDQPGITAVVYGEYKAIYDPWGDHVFQA